jgi:hypothetical protein
MAFVYEVDRGLNKLNINSDKLGPGCYIGQEKIRYIPN